jgi:hypothetical protein
MCKCAMQSRVASMIDFKLVDTLEEGETNSLDMCSRRSSIPTIDSVRAGQGISLQIATQLPENDKPAQI